MTVLISLDGLKWQGLFMSDNGCRGSELMLAVNRVSTKSQ